jgi:glutamate carboxypeptidase
MSTESQITAWLADQHDAMVALLRDMVDIDSGSYDKPGIDAVGAVVQRFLAGHGIPVEVVPQQKHGDCLRATVAGGDAVGTGSNAGS